MPNTAKKPQVNLSGIAAELTKAINVSGLSDTELHRRTGLSRTVIIGYKTGRRKPGEREIRLLCDALRVTPNRLIYGKENPFETETGLLASLGVSSDQKISIRMAVLFQMLTAQEKGAILTVLQALLEARHGKETLEMAVKALSVMEDLIGNVFGSSGLDLEKNLEKFFTPERVAQLEAQFKAAGIDETKLPKTPGQARKKSVPRT